MFYRPNDVEIVETVSAPGLVKSWKSDFGIDVAHVFDGVETLSMLRDASTGRMWFDPAPVGDAAFYTALRRFKWYHPKRKEEYAAAAYWLRPLGRVLDVGAGLGDFARYVPASNYLGLETDPRAVVMARQLDREVLPLRAEQWRRAADFQPADLVASFQVLEHVPDPDAFAAALVSCLSPGGRLVVGVPDAESYVADLPDFMLNAPPHHLSWWTEQALKQLLERQGLRIVAVERFQVEHWERRLWWMARIARGLRRGRNTPAFGRKLFWAKAAGWIGAWPLQWTAPKAARGSTMLMIAERA